MANRGSGDDRRRSEREEEDGRWSGQGGGGRGDYGREEEGARFDREHDEDWNRGMPSARQWPSEERWRPGGGAMAGYQGYEEEPGRYGRGGSDRGGYGEGEWGRRRGGEGGYGPGYGQGSYRHGAYARSLTGPTAERGDWRRGQGYGTGQSHGYQGGQGGYGARSFEPEGPGGYGQGSFGRGEFGQEPFRQGGFGYGAETWRGPFRGRGPKGYKRSDERIREDVSDRLEQHGAIDAIEIEVKVENGEVTLEGRVADRQTKRMAEDVVEDVPGVKQVHNRLRVQRGEESTTGSAASRGASISGSTSGVIAGTEGSKRTRQGSKSSRSTSRS